MGFEHLNCEVQIRYQSKAVSSVVKKINNGYRIEFNHPQLAVTPGQSAVIYVGDECIGGGAITERISEKYFSWADKRGYNYRTYE